MTATIVSPRPSRTPLAAHRSVTKRRHFSRKDRVEAGVILAGFALALAFASNQLNTTATSWSWSTEHSAALNAPLQVGAWLPVAIADGLNDEDLYRLCVTTMGAGTMAMSPLQLADAVALTDGAPTTTCAEPQNVQGHRMSAPGLTVTEPESTVTVLSASWERLVISGS